MSPSAWAGWPTAVGLLAPSTRELKFSSTFRTGKSIPCLQRRALERSDRLVANSREALERLQNKYGIDRGPDAKVITCCIRKFPQQEKNNRLWEEIH